MPNPRLYAGQTMTADKWNSILPKLITQENDQVITNSSVMVDSEISFTPEPNGVYVYKLLISYSATVNSDLVWQWNAPGIALASFTQGYAREAGDGVNTGAMIIMRRPADTTNRLAGGTDLTSPPANFHSAYDRGTFATDGTTQQVTLQFSQGTAHADETILRGGNQTRLIYQRIG